MKFKAAFTDRGLRALEKGFVPTLEKFGKTCQLLLGPADVYLIQTGVNTDGVHVTARLSREVLFTTGSFVISSRSDDQIAFGFEVANLLRVLRSASANGAELLEMRLTMRSGAADAAPRPFLTFTSRGDSLHIVHDLPISAPYKAAEIDRLVQELNRTESLCTYYVDIQPEVARLQSVVDKLKSLGDTALLAITNGGDMHVQVQDSCVELGIELRRLPVLPQDEADKARPLTGQSAEARLREIQGAGDAAVVSVQLKHIARSLQVSQLTQPQQLLCGIGANNGHVHFMFVYKDPFSDEAFDDKISLSYKLPVREDT